MVEQLALTKKIEAYYRGERVSNATLVLIGSIAIVWTFLLFYWRQGHLSSGFFYSAFPLGLFYIFTGSYRFIRSFKRYSLTLREVASRDYFIKDEVPLIQGRTQRFLKKRNVDTIGFIIGFAFCIIIVMSKMNHVFLGTSVSITLFSAILLVFDLFGQFRSEEYVQYLERNFF